MAAFAASRLLFHLRPELGLDLRSRVLIPSFSSGAERMDLAWHTPPRRRLVSCLQAARDNSPEGNAAKKNAVSSPDEQLAHYKGDDNGATLEPIEKIHAEEFAQLSSVEEESGNMGSRIKESIAQDVEKAAIELLAGRAFTVSELRKKLRGKKYPVDTVDAVVADFKGRGLLNDGLYAESFSRSRWLSSTWGPRRIKQVLRQKGVSEAEVDQATKRVFQDGHGHASGHKTQYGISEDSMDHLFVQASKLWHRGQNLPLENRRSRVVRWLQYRGFNWAVTNAIVRRLEAQ